VPQRLITIPLQQLEGLLSESWSAFRGSSRYRDVPALDPSLGLVGEALLDRTFTTTTSALVGVPAPETVRQARDEVIVARDVFVEEGWLDDPASYHGEPSPPRGPRLETCASRATTRPTSASRAASAGWRTRATARPTPTCSSTTSHAPGWCACTASRWAHRV
jgi:hypothetical protein